MCYSSYKISEFWFLSLLIFFSPKFEITIFGSYCYVTFINYMCLIEDRPFQVTSNTVFGAMLVCILLKIFLNSNEFYLSAIK